MAHQLKMTPVLEGYGLGLICQLQAGHFCCHPTRIGIQLKQGKIPQSTQMFITVNMYLSVCRAVIKIMTNLLEIFHVAKKQ